MCLSRATDTGQRFTRSQRLLKPSEFKRIFDKTQKKVVTTNFVLLSSGSEHEQHRLGLIVAKKRLKLAVERNRIKRLCRETFRTSSMQAPAIDVIVMLRQSIGDVHDPALAVELQKALQKIDLFYRRGAQP